MDGTGTGTASLVVLMVVLWLSTGGECSTSAPPPFRYEGGEFAIAGLVSRSTSNDGGILDAIADFQIRSWSLMENQTNAKGGVWINGISYRLKIHAFNVGFGSTPDNITSMVARVNDIIVYQKYGYFPVVLAPFPSDYNLRIAAVCDAHHRLLVTIDLSDYIYQCPDPPDPEYGADCMTRNLKPGQRRYSYVFSTMFATSKYWNGAIYTLKLAGAQTVALITVPHIQAQSATKGIQEALSNAGMTLVYHYSASINESLSDSMVTNRVIQHLITHYPSVDVLIVHNDDGSSNTVINSMLKYNFMTKAALFAVPPGDYGTDPLVGGQDSAKYFVSVLLFDPRLQATVSPTTYPHDLYVSSVNPTTGLVNSDAAYQAYLSLSQHLDPYSSVFDPLLVVPVLVIKRALDHIRDINYTSIIQNFNWINMTDINQEPRAQVQVQAQAQADLFATQLRTIVQNMYEDSFYGRLQFDAFGRYATDAVVLQAKTAGEYDLVYPLHSATAKFVYPVPTWDERVYRPEYAQTRNERIILAMASVALLILLTLSGAIYWCRKEPQVRAASPRFIQCLLLGCMLMIISIYTWTLYETSASCAAHVWLFSLGYVLMFSPLFAKTWRLWTIFCTRSMQVVPITDSKLAAQGPAPMLLVELCLLLIWHSSAPFDAITVYADPLRPSSNYDTCYYNHVSEAFFYVSVAYKVVMLLGGCALIWFCRNIPDAYNETPYIAACIYQVLFTAAILIPIVSTDALNRDIRFIVRSCGIMGATTLAACTLCIPKLYYVYTARNKSKSHSSDGSGSNPLINSTFMTTEKHMSVAPRKRSTTASAATRSFPARPQSLLPQHQKKSSFVSDIVINRDTDTGTGAHPSLTSSPALVPHLLEEKPMPLTGASAGVSASAAAPSAPSLSLSPSPSAPVTYSDILQQAFSMIREHCSVTLQEMEHMKHTIQEHVQQMEISLLLSSAGTGTGTADHDLNETDTDHQLDHPDDGDTDHSMEPPVMPTWVHVNFPQEQEQEHDHLEQKQATPSCRVPFAQIVPAPAAGQ